MLICTTPRHHHHLNFERETALSPLARCLVVAGAGGGGGGFASAGRWAPVGALRCKRSVRQEGAGIMESFVGGQERFEVDALV